jgi:hypothetical protein
MLDPKYFKKIYEKEFPQYPTKIPLSLSRRAKYYSTLTGKQRVNKIPKWLEKKGYTIDPLGFCLDENQERIIANKRSVGTPKYSPINGQIFYSQKGGKFTRAKVVKYLHEYFVENTKDVPVFKTYPMVLTLDWKIPYGYQTMDNTNMSFAYVKVFEDVLVATEKITDDEVRYISGGASIFTPVDTFEDRSLVFTFYEDNRKEIQQLKLL